MPQKIADFELVFDPFNIALKGNREPTRTKLMNRSAKAFTFFSRNSNCKVYLKDAKKVGDVEVLFGTDTLLGVTVPSMAEFRAFSKSEDLGFYRLDPSKTLVEWDPEDEPDGAVGGKPLNMAEYYTGKARTADNGGGFTFTCTITIPKDTWEQVKKLGAGIGIKQIEGILQQDPILISQKSKIQGVRCIKPEPYGWIFSTSVSTRLVATNTPTGTVNPTALTFDGIESGH